MKKLVLIGILMYYSQTWCAPHPLFVDAYFTDTRTKIINTTVYKGETRHIPLVLMYNFLRGPKFWSYQPDIGGLYLQNKGPNLNLCPNIVGDYADYMYWEATCAIDFQVSSAGHPVGAVRSGSLHYKARGFNIALYFGVFVIAHPLTMNTIQQQDATIGQRFIYDLKQSAVRYYGENLEAKDKPIGFIANDAELKQLGLSLDPDTLVISGIPTQIGTYTFLVRAQNKTYQPAATPLTVRVHYNQAHKPIFKKKPAIATAIANQNYTMNLLSLIEPQTGFVETNQISFRILSDAPLNLSAAEPAILVGKIDKRYAGKQITVTVIATSNTGGDSEPYELIIPVQHDLAKRPVIEPLALEYPDNQPFNINFAEYIHDPAQDPALSIIIDKIERVNLEYTEPVLPTWLSIPEQTPAILEGYPRNAAGQKYLITVRANTEIGGSSDPITIPLQIKHDLNMMPRFKDETPQISKMYPGQEYSHDFVAHHDVYPDFEEEPYIVRFAKNYDPPEWLKLENNKLFAKSVPVNVPAILDIYLVIQNIKGGTSEEITVTLR